MVDRMGNGSGIMKLELKKKRRFLRMGSRLDFGHSGFRTEPKNLKENFLMVNEIASGLLGMIMEIKNSKLLMIMVN